MTDLPSRRFLHAARLAVLALVVLAIPQASRAQDDGGDTSCTETSCGDTNCGQLGQPPCPLGSQESQNNGSLIGCDRGLALGFGSNGNPFSCVSFSRGKAEMDDWVAKALRLQRELQADLPLNRLAVLGAHNAYNNEQDGYILPNQYVSITDVLRMGIRKISLDVHWYNNALRLCHRDSSHGTCSWFDRPFYQAIEELNQWMRRPENRQEVVIVDLELYLEGHQAELIAPIKRHLGDLVLRRSEVPSLDKPGTPLPTLEAIRQLGRRLILMEGSGVNGHDLFIPLSSANGSESYEYAKIKNFVPEPCGYRRSNGEVVTFDPTYPNTTKYIDFYEDSIWPFDVGLIDPLKLEQLTACHATHISLDKVDSNKLKPAVWSWDSNQPNNWNGGDCAEKLVEGRWNDTSCGAIKRFACRRIGDQLDSDTWRVTAAAGEWYKGVRQCALEFGSDYRFDVPRTGYENQFLGHAAQGLNVWLNLTDSLEEGKWKSPSTELPVVEFKSLGKCMDLANSNTENGTRVLLWDCHGGKNQKWILFEDGTIRSAVKDGKCLDLANSNTSNGSNILIWDCHGGANQRWSVDGPFLRSALNQNKVLDVQGANTANGTRIQLWDYHGGAGQQWQQVPQ